MGERGGGASGGTAGGKSADHDLGANQSADARGFCCTMETGGAIDAIAIGQCESGIFERRRRLCEIFWIAACFEKGEGASSTKFYVVLGSGHI